MKTASSAPVAARIVKIAVAGSCTVATTTPAVAKRTTMIRIVTHTPCHVIGVRPTPNRLG